MRLKHLDILVREIHRDIGGARTLDFGAHG
jgi:hypothetical protein